MATYPASQASHTLTAQLHRTPMVHSTNEKANANANANANGNPSANDRALPQEDLARLLAKTSRTFALAIPLLDEPLARQVGIAYLLFRMADELEDAPLWQRDRRTRALASFARWVDDRDEAPNDNDEAANVWQTLVREAPPTTDEGCLELLARSNDVLAATRALAPAVQAAILGHTRRTAIGMKLFVERQDVSGGLCLQDVTDLRAYCYVVAGIVGELLTDLFVLAAPNLASEEVRMTLDAEARSFGEGLQLVNILKDAPSDSREGRVYLPRNAPRATVIDLARSDLRRSARYVSTLESAKAAPGMIAFCDLPMRLAEATLDALDQGAPKLTREDVMRIFNDVTTKTTTPRS